MAPLIEARGLTRRFGERVVLDRLDFQVERGERLALLGLNGAGKTTLLRCLMGVLGFEGSIAIDGIDVSTMGARARRLIGYVPQRPPLFSMTIRGMVEFFSHLRGMETGAVAERLAALDMPLGEVGELTPAQLSGGMLQKALLGLALAADPPLLLLDEPTANLDARARAEFLRGLDEVGEETTVLLASHRLDEVEQVADRMWVIHGGHRVFNGSLEELRRLAGADSWLWFRTTPEGRAAARSELADLAGEEAVLTNGTRIGVRLPPDRRAQAVARLEGAGIPIEDLWITRPSLEEVVEDFFAVEEGP